MAGVQFMRLGGSKIGADHVLLCQPMQRLRCGNLIPATQLGGAVGKLSSCSSARALCQRQHANLRQVR